MRGRRVAPANCEMLDWALWRTGSLRFIGRCFLGESLKRGEASSDVDASGHHDAEGRSWVEVL